MANKQRGEVSLPYEGKDYTMVMDFNALCDFEDKAGKPVGDVLEALQTGKIVARDMRALIWAGLKQRHPDMTLELAGQILSSNPAILDEGLVTAFPAPEAKAGNGKRAKAKGA